MTVLPMGVDEDDDPRRSEALTAERLSSFDAAKSHAFKVQDRQRLWAVIESAFGTFGAFNSRVRATLAPALVKADNIDIEPTQLFFQLQSPLAAKKACTMRAEGIAEPGTVVV